MPHIRADFGSGLVSTTPMVRNSANTAWQTCEVYVRNDANTAWIKIYPLNHTASMSPTQINGIEPNGSTSAGMTAVIVGGTGPFTYAWSWQSGGAGMTLSNTTSATVTINASGTNVARSGVIQCVVTDTGNANYAVTPTADVAFQFGTPL